MTDYNDKYFLYCYFKALEKVGHTDPQYVNYCNKNYTFKESGNTETYHYAIYEFDGDEVGIKIAKDEFNLILTKIGLQEHAEIGKVKLS